MSGFDRQAQELIGLVGLKKALTLCKQHLERHDKSTERYDKWRKIKRCLEAKQK